MLDHFPASPRGHPQRATGLAPLGGHLRAEIVAPCQRGDRTIAQVVAEFDLVDPAVRR
jgi:hypothetical protein